MRVLIACECSGVVRRAFIEAGHDAWSCDLLPAFDQSPAHIQGDVLELLARDPRWDLLIAHPPCTHLACSGARWFREKGDVQAQAVVFARTLLETAIPHVCLENPIGILSTHLRQPDQIIQPWQFGHGETKATCLWLTRLPRLVPTAMVAGRVPRVHHEAPGPDRWLRRSVTLPGIAAAMAAQWSDPMTFTLQSEWVAR